MTRLCLVHLQSGDTLASLAKAYGTTPEAIASMNGVAWSRRAIDEWVVRTGGRINANGWAVFTGASQIYLPADGVRSCLDASSSSALIPSKPRLSGLGVMAVVALVGGYLLKRFSR